MTTPPDEVSAIRARDTERYSMYGVQDQLSIAREDRRTLLRLLDTQRAEIERLGAIVGRLPKDAKGATVFPGETLYKGWVLNGRVHQVYEYLAGGEITWWTDPVGGEAVRISECHRTEAEAREAADAAREGK